jgi:hypothetical protein
MTCQERFEQALRSTDPPEALRSAVLALAGEGLSKDQINEALGQFLDQVRAQNEGRESEAEEIVLGVMDAMTGWCHPSRQLM